MPPACVRSSAPANTRHDLAHSAEEGVPQDLIYLAVAESGFQPQALNARSGAGGMWQFMPTGAYGLARNGWFDERFDPEKSSRAYARYMKSLYNQFGDWYLAMAAIRLGSGQCATRSQRPATRTSGSSIVATFCRARRKTTSRHHRSRHHGEESGQYGLDAMTFDPPIVTDT